MFTPVSWIVTDATTIIATFDFTGAPRGLYDLIVTNPDGASAALPYRFLVERAIEPDVTIGLGGPRVILAGDTGLYSVALQSLTNIDIPYTFFQFGIPEMGINEDVYGLPYLQFASNLRGGPTTGPLAGLAWDDLNSAVNTTGQLLASGYALDLPADGFTGLSFTTTTYPGLKELNDRAFEQLKAKIYAMFPNLAKQGVLDNGPNGLDEIYQGLGLIYDAFGSLPDLLTKPFVPFQFHVTAAATALNRDEFVAHAEAEADRLRLGILADRRVARSPARIGRRHGSLATALLAVAGRRRPAASGGCRPRCPRAHAAREPDVHAGRRRPRNLGWRLRSSRAT